MPHPDFDLTRFLPYELAVLSERISKALSVVYVEKHGLSVADWRVLVHTARQGSVSVREIHRTANLEKPRVSRSVAKLETLGYLKKKLSAKDKRLVEISLTPEGAAVLEDILPKALAFEQSLQAAVSPAERKQLSDLAARLHARLDTLEHEGS